MKTLTGYFITVAGYMIGMLALYIKVTWFLK